MAVLKVSLLHNYFDVNSTVGYLMMYDPVL